MTDVSHEVTFVKIQVTWLRPARAVLRGRCRPIPTGASGGVLTMARRVAARRSRDLDVKGQIHLSRGAVEAVPVPIWQSTSTEWQNGMTGEPLTTPAHASDAPVVEYLS